MDHFTQAATPPFDKMLGRKLRTQRIQHGLTQKDLGRKLDVSFQQVQKYEAGINALSAERLWQLSKIFSVSMHYWVDGNEGEKIFAGLQEQEMQSFSVADERRAVHLMQYFSRIENEELKTLLFAFSKALAGEGKGAAV